jgi:hypothetical protein
MTNKNNVPQSDKPKTQPIGYWMAIGTAIGAGLGVALDNIGVGVAIGVVIGAAQAQRNKNK